MSCKKCYLPKTVVLRKKDYYCDDCFMVGTNHKFRACLGKNKVLSPNENVLTCLSGGISSTVLLDLLNYSLSLDSTKKLRIIPFFLHIIENDQVDIAEHVINQCNKLNFKVYVVNLSEYLNINHKLPDVNCIPLDNPDVAIQFKNMLNSMPSTAANDFLLKIKRDLFIKYAKLLQCNIIFTAETTNTLAINLLSNLAVGRGSQVHYDVGFCDNRDGIVKILRPMKDINKEELDYYVTLKQLQPIYSTKNNNSLQSVISTFICDLQENFQSTISTVCKTADKIGNCDEIKTHIKCLLCESNLRAKDLKMSALEATNVSRAVSFTNSSTNSSYTDITNNCENAVFPFVHKYLCYGCSRNHMEMNQLSLPPHLQFFNL